MKTRYLPVSILAISIATSNAFGANGDVILTVYGNALNAARYGATVGYVDLSNYVTTNQLASELSDFGEFLFTKAEEVTEAKNQAQTAADAVASKVNRSDLRDVAFTGMASDLNNDIGWIDQESAYHLITSTVNTAMQDNATQTWTTSNFASKSETQDSLDEINSQLVDIARMANNASSAVSAKADASNVYTKSESDALFATQEWVQSELADAASAMNILGNGITALNQSVNTINSALDTKANTSDLATVATTGRASDLDNDAGFITSAALSDYITTDAMNDVLATKADLSDIYTKTQADSMFASQSSLNDLSSQLDQLSSAYETVTGTSTEMQTAISNAQRTADAAAEAAVAAQGSADAANALYMAAVEFIVDMNTRVNYLGDDVEDKANLSDLAAVATTGLASDLNNDAGFITRDVNDLTNYTTTEDMNLALSTKANAADVYTKSEIDAKTDALESAMSDFARTSDLESINTQLANLTSSLENAGTDYNTAMTKAESAITAAELASSIASTATSTAATASENATNALNQISSANENIAALQDNFATMSDTLLAKADASSVYDKGEIDDKLNAIVDGELANINTSLAELTSNVSTTMTDVATAQQTADNAIAALENVYTKTDVDSRLSELSDDVTNTTATAIAQLAETVQQDLDTKANIANVYDKATIDSMLGNTITTDQVTAMVSNVASTARVSLADANNVDSDCTVANAIESLDKTIGASIGATTNGLSASNSVNENIAAINDVIGDSSQMRNGNAITKGTGTMPDTVVNAINNIDETIGKIHGLFDGTSVGATNITSSTGAGSNLAVGTTVEDHLVSLDNAIGDRNISSANTAINNAAAVSTSAALSATGDIIGTMDFTGTNYLDGVTNITDALRTLDANLGSAGGSATIAKIKSIENKIDQVETKLDRGMAAMTALTALVPNSRASGRTQISVGTGAYANHVGIAAGAFHYVNNRVLLNAGASYGGDKNLAFRAGITFGW